MEQREEGWKERNEREREREKERESSEEDIVAGALLLC